MMNRRAFLERLLAGAAGTALAATLDVDKLLWQPGARTIFLPPPPQIIGPFLRRGDVFTIAGRYAWNPITRQPLPYLQQFVATEDFAPELGDVSFTFKPQPRIWPNPALWREWMRVPYAERLTEAQLVKPLLAGLTLGE
jgi:hypothetical protein